MKVGVIDYGVGNLGSVMQALHSLRAEPVLLTRAGDVAAVDRLVLPGVGSFTDCKRALDDGGWSVALVDAVQAEGKPLLGICVGMQLLASRGTEGSERQDGTAGLGLIPGQVQALRTLGCTLRLPHMGWNGVQPLRADGLMAGIPAETDFYFVHSYSFLADDPRDVLATTDYGLPVTAAVRRGTVMGTQFHPEKSGRAGFALLRNFLQALPC